MKRYKVLFFVFQLLVCTTVHANVLDICSTCENKQIGKAISLANAHDTLLVQKGVYKEFALSIDKPLTLLGVGNPTIDAEGKGEIISVTSDSVNIIGFIIKNVGISHTRDLSAVHLYKVDYFNLIDNQLENVFFGFLIEKSHHGLISNNKVQGEGKKEFFSGNGIHLWHCSDVIVEKNHLSGLRDGIYFEFVDESKVRNNVSIGNIRYGLHFMFSNNDTYSNNRFENNGAGVAVMFSKFVNMNDNLFIKNWGPASYGLLLKEIYDSEIVNNRFQENTIGINIDGSSRIHYKNNDFIRNGWAVKVTGGCYTNKFEYNNFISNAFDVSYNSNLNDNLFINNYWSNYTGYDINKDSFGDIPFRPVNLFSYVVNQTPETIILLRSLFVDILNFSEKVSPAFTPDNLVDEAPLMKKIQW